MPQPSASASITALSTPSSDATSVEPTLDAPATVIAEEITEAPAVPSEETQAIVIAPPPTTATRAAPALSRLNPQSRPFVPRSLLAKGKEKAVTDDSEERVDPLLARKAIARAFVTQECFKKGDPKAEVRYTWESPMITRTYLNGTVAVTSRCECNIYRRCSFCIEQIRGYNKAVKRVNVSGEALRLMDESRHRQRMSGRTY